MTDQVNNMNITYSALLRDTKEFIEDRDIFQCVVNICAIQGAGKTHILQRLHAEFVDNAEWSTCFLGIEAQGDHEGFLSKDEGSTVFRAQSFYRELADQLKIFPHAGETPESDKLIQGIVDHLQSRQHKGNDKRILLIIDDYDLIHAVPRKQFEDEILSRIIRLSNRSVVILSSQQRLEFNNRLDVSSRLHPIELKGISVDDIEQLLLAYLDHDYASAAKRISQRIKTWSNGMPKLVELLVKQIQSIPPNEINAWLDNGDAQPSRTFYDKLRQVSFSKQDDPESVLIHALDTLSLIRRFDVSILSNLLPRIDPDSFEGKKQKDYLNLIRDLGSRVRWRTDGGGYTLDPLLKEMLYVSIRSFERSFFEQVQRDMIEVCRVSLDKRYNLNHLIELGYHHYELKRMHESDADAKQVINNVFKKYLNDPKFEWDSDMLTAFRETLHLDAELHALVYDTTKLIGEKINSVPGEGN